MARARVFGFRCLHVARLVGPFAGYALGNIYRLDDRSTYRQVSDYTEPASAPAPSDSPCAWLYTDGTQCYLDVDGAHGVVEVAACVDPESPLTRPAHSWPPR